MKAEQIAKLIEVIVRKELKRFKSEIISEISSVKIKGQPIVETRQSTSDPNKKINERFRQNVKYNSQPSRKQLHSDPMLNELLMSTQPLESSYDDPMMDLDINVPTTEGGRPITNIPDSVLKAMNKDYSGMFSGGNEPSSKSTATDKLRRMVMEEDYEPSPVSNDDADEDFSFLDNVL